MGLDELTRERQAETERGPTFAALAGAAFACEHPVAGMELLDDLTAARVHGIIDALTSRAIACYADKGYLGAGGAIGTPYKRRKRRRLGKRKKLFNRHHAQVRAPGEQGAATLKGWRILRKARCSPSRLTAIVQAILTLHHHAN